MSALVDQARTYLGVRWRHRGRSRDGVDCAGLPWCCYRDLGVVLPDLTAEATGRPVYGREPHKDGLMDAVVAALGEPVFDGPEVGDIVVLAFVREPHHLAIVGDDRYHGLSLIHADGTPRVVDGVQLPGSVVEHGLTDHFRKMIVATFRRPV